ncbi:MAG: radical SAM protein [Veillonella sp.]|nr:radical SAM protein [Veillonella sp.]
MARRKGGALVKASNRSVTGLYKRRENRPERPKKRGLIPFFIPHLGCPQICSFCNQHRIAKEKALDSRTSQELPSSLPSAQDVKATIEEYIGSGRTDKYWEVAFYGGSFSAIPRAWQEAVLAPAYEALLEGKIDGIRCSTRPDALALEDVDFLLEHGVTTVEIGVQSMDNQILQMANRGHNRQDVIDAVGRLKEKGMTIGLQIMPGLAGETWTSLVETAVAIKDLRPDFVRIYPVLVIENTDLADAYRAGDYQALTLDQAVAYGAFLKDYWEAADIEVIRTGLQATRELDQGRGLVAGPYHPSFGELVENKRWRDRIQSLMDDVLAHLLVNKQNGLGDPLQNGLEEPLEIHVSYPLTMTSQIKGLKSANAVYFESTYPNFNWSWKGDDTRVTIRVGKLIFVL